MINVEISEKLETLQSPNKSTTAMARDFSLNRPCNVRLVMLVF
jgi:hypothetical protein